MKSDNWRPEADLAVIRQRAAMLSRARAWFAAEGVLEVQTPLLSACAASDPQIESIVAQPSRGGPSFLHTSPEFAMKRLLAAGIGDCYQIGPAFRDGESGRLHNPEFTLIEWYRVGRDAAALERDVEALLLAAVGTLRRLPTARSMTYREAVADQTGLDCAVASPPELAAALAARGIVPVDTMDWDRDAWLDLLMGAVVGPALGRDGPLFVRDYPASQAALARLRDDGNGWPVAERFELYLDGVELANGFHELGDVLEQRRRFEQDQELRRRRGQRVAPLDHRLLAALESGLPDCAGVALGFDRLVMTALGLPSIGAAMAFPAERA